MRRKDKQLLNLVRKKKKLAPPFQSKVEGGNARARPDRAAMKRQEGGTIGSVRRRVPPGERREPPPLTGPTEGLQRGGDVKALPAPKPLPLLEKPDMARDLERDVGAISRATRRKDGGDTGGKWIGKARASMERRGTVGSLRKAMGAKEGQKIPTARLEAKKAQAERTGNTKMMRKVNFALNVRK
jgi:hypothetical protein